MKTCLQCSTAYDDDYVFCMQDGNALIEDGPEQETVVNRKFGMPTPDVGLDMPAYCASCGLENKAHSKFCKKCGANLTAGNMSGESSRAAANQPFKFVMPDNQNFQGSQHRYDETRAFQAPVFTPPAVSGRQQATSNYNKNQNNILIAVVVVGGAIVVGAMIYSAQSGSKKTDSPISSSDGGKTNPSSPAPARNAMAPANVMSSIVGRKGHLTTNQHIRSDPNKYAQDSGVHYQGAKIQILDQTTFTNDDGSYATWYRVLVLEDGCDRDGAMGCGNDLNGMPGQAAREGWMSAKNISLE